MRITKIDKIIIRSCLLFLMILGVAIIFPQKADSFPSKEDGAVAVIKEDGIEIDHDYDDDTFIVPVEYVRTIDGDTFVVDIPGYPHPFNKNMHVRIDGIDTPEKQYKVRCLLEKEKAYIATGFTRGALEAARVIELHNMRIGTFGRLEAGVFVDDVDLAQFLLDSACNPKPLTYAAPSVNGAAKYDWCGDFVASMEGFPEYAVTLALVELVTDSDNIWPPSLATLLNAIKKHMVSEKKKPDWCSEKKR